MAWGGLASESLLYLTAINWFGRGRHMMTVSTRANRSAPRWGAALACAIAVATPGRAHAANPLNSTDQTTASAQAACTSGDRDEFNIVPIIGGTSDIGIGVGEFSDLARVSRGVDPYLWNIESGGFITFKGSDNGIQIPFQDLYFKITIPRFLRNGLQLEVRPAYTWEETLGYFGMGNASKDVTPPGAKDSFSWYGRLHPAVDLQLRYRLADHIAALVGARYTQNWLQIAADSRLALDIKFGSPEVKKLIGPTNPGGVALFSYGFQWDSRDSEVSSHVGSFEEALIRLSPGGTEDFPYRYAQGSLVARGFVPIWRDHVTLAVRGVGDIMFGNPPFYELSRFDDTYALGGPNGVRGIPGQRYYGKVKVFGNFEVRSDLFSFHALGKPLRFGFILFFDAGRVWADTSAQPQLDGTGLGLHYGTGPGLRLQSGETFVLRADVAYSPDAHPIGAYFAAGQTF
jgi:outer membrane protein assembly factor BamA